MKRNLNIFDKIGTLIPGYKGYQEREGRRECDRQLREQIADKLFDIEADIEKVIEFSEIEKFSELEKIRKKINNMNGIIKYSPYGSSAFFSNSVIKEPELDTLYQLDLDILDSTNELKEKVKSANYVLITENIEFLKKLINERNRYLKNI
jgi:hypothetical protein